MTDLVPATRTGFDLAVVAPLSDLAERICRTDFVPPAFRGKPEATLAAMLTGDELGIKPMTALQKIHVIDGRPGLASELMRALILQQGHELWVEEKTATRVTIAGCRRGSDRVSRVTWTADDVKRAGLGGRTNHQKFPRAMLTARATAELARDIFPDVIGGLYAVEELQDGFIESDVAEVVEDTPAPVDDSPTHIRSATKRAPAKASQRKPKGSPTGPSAGRSSEEHERPPAPPIKSIEAKPVEVIEAKTWEPEPLGEDTADPFDEPEPPTEEEAVEMVKKVFPGAKATEETGELVDEVNAARLRKKLEELDEEQRSALSQEWRKAHLGAIREGGVKLLASKVDKANELLDAQLATQKDVYDRRRKHVNAALAEIGINEDDARHDFIASATDGATDSSKALLGRYVKQINDLVEATKAEQRGES